MYNYSREELITEDQIIEGLTEVYGFDKEEATDMVESNGSYIIDEYPEILEYWNK